MQNFYTNVKVSGKYILFRGIENGTRVRRRIEYAPTIFLPCNEKSKHRTLYGQYVKPVKPGSIAECRQFLEQYKEVEGFTVYGNTKYEYTFISDWYPDDIHWDMDKVEVVSIDIEVGSENGFPEPKDANEEITAITMKHRGKLYVFGCGDFNNYRDDVWYIKCRNEIDLIKNFIDQWTLIWPDIATGWNVKFFPGIAVDQFLQASRWAPGR